LFQKAGLKMPDNPTWTQVAEFAAKLNDKANRSYGLCIRGQPGWGENMTDNSKDVPKIIIRPFSNLANPLSKSQR
jgi:ABC-type glycerol-3-phosphate transport system substrate-binding protein